MTTLNESFDKADSDTLGPDLSWTELSGDQDVVSNAWQAQPFSTQVLGRADSDLASTDHYAEIVISACTAVDTSGHGAGPVCRKDSTATNTYYIGRLLRTTTSGGTNQVQLYKRVAGTFTQLGSSVTVTVALPPSLRNIFKELQRDLGRAPPVFPVPGGSLVRWAGKGVLLLNTCLTVEQGAPASHAKQGWETLTDALIAACSAHESPKVFLLWGAHAQSKLGLIDASRHLVLQANHPSPLSARRPPRPFIGCGHFGQARQWLEKKAQKNLNWL